MFRQADRDSASRRGWQGPGLTTVTAMLGFLRLIYRVPWFVLHLLLGTPLTDEPSS